jgi:hypothetical protein
MNFINIDPMIGQMLSQLVHLKTQVEQVKSVDGTVFLSAISDYSNLLGVEMAKQATGKSTWSPQDNPSIVGGVDMSASVLEQITTQKD